MKANVVLVPGAWTGAWGWAPLEKHLESSNHKTYSLTLSGLDNDADASEVDLERHVADVVAFLESNNLSNVVLVGHSYSGIVVGLVAQRLPERIKHLVFVEAFIPIAGKSLLESAELDVEEETNATENNGGRWPAPTRAELEGQPFLKEEDKGWLSKNLVGHPGKTVTDKVPTNLAPNEIDATFIGKELPHLRGEHFNNMGFIRLEGGHWPMVTAPEALAKSINEIASRT